MDKVERFHQMIKLRQSQEALFMFSSEVISVFPKVLAFGDINYGRKNFRMGC